MLLPVGSESGVGVNEVPSKVAQADAERVRHIGPGQGHHILHQLRGGNGAHEALATDLDGDMI